MADAAEAIQHAHDVEVLHRDIKPSNIMVDRRGACWIIDFGLARSERMAADPRAAAVGTLRYMSPEQAGSIDRPIGPPADLYAVGILL